MSELLRLDSVEYDASKGPDSNDDDPVDGFPTFLVRGVFLPTGAAFVRSVALELDGRDADETHVSGLDLDTLNNLEITEELYNKLYASEAYQHCARAFHAS